MKKRVREQIYIKTTVGILGIKQLGYSSVKVTWRSMVLVTGSVLCRARVAHNNDERKL
jgi:hypothetical protein